MAKVHDVSYDCVELKDLHACIAKQHLRIRNTVSQLGYMLCRMIGQFSLP
jgi:hypothetical protein